MLQTGRKIISSLLCIALLLCLMSGCQAAGEKKKTSDGRAESTKYTDLQAKELFVENNIVIEEVYPFDNGENNHQYLQISGLKDKSVEDKINARLLGIYNEMNEGNYVPPYRGAKQLMDDVERNATTKWMSVMCYEAFNCNGLLSVMPDCSFFANDGSGNGLGGWQYMEPVTFDLSTGEELTLADIFPKGTDYIECVNDAVDKYIMKNGYDNTADGITEDGFYDDVDRIGLTAPFKSIKPDQKFYIESDGRLVLVMDYDTPEFYTNFYPIYIDTEYDVKPTYTGKNMSADIFEDSSTVYRLMEGADPAVDMVYNYGSTRQKEGYDFEYNYRLSKSIPQDIYNTMLDICTTPLSVDIPIDLDTMTVLYKEYTVYKSGSSYTVGDYYNLNIILSSSYLDGDDDNYHSESEQRLYCFKEGSTDYVYIYDLFNRSTEDAAELIKNAIMARLVNSHGADARQAETVAQKLCELIYGVNVDVDRLYVSYAMTDEKLEEFFKSVLGDREDIYACVNSTHSLYYRDLGCENLILFDKAK